MKLLILITTLILLVSCNEEAENRRRPNITPSDRQYILGGSEEGSKYLISQSHRDKDLADNVSLLSNYQEASLSRSGQTYPSHYRNIPMVNLDHDNANSLIERPQVKCGMSGDGIQAKLDDCKSKNTTRSEFKGKRFGNMGEGDWKLVAKSEDGSAGHEVWMDMRTRLIWSDRLEANNWCKASGNQEDEGGIDCSSNTLFYCTSDNLFQEAKGNTETIVDWRLPSRNDLLQADINGARVILKNSNHHFWSATIDSNNNGKAWTVHGKTGELESTSRSSGSPSIRCVGRILK